jgi:hypothetical protein
MRNDGDTDLVLLVSAFANDAAGLAFVDTAAVGTLVRAVVVDFAGHLHHMPWTSVQDVWCSGDIGAGEVHQPAASRLRSLRCWRGRSGNGTELLE